ncbi:DoxX family protein [Noviherbaspirillum pedocola]|uniref:DoxX family protein n=1 Tax=Noviherbaspirillum pedocola TaxID=2801341 RepID=A0A934T320_9BURK|nr:hypothetical protein [Noviherbaspirillum pedocola]MBK4737348.1 hypothetical protein [Noviherbaspirillum pedocola]
MMTTPIIMLALMMLPWTVTLAWYRARRQPLDGSRSAVIGLTLLFVFTGIGHFVQTMPMVQMLPPWVPQREALVYASGLLEFAIAIGFLFTRTRRTTGWLAVAVLIGFFPLNIYAAIHHVPMGGHAWGPAYLLIRAPLQIAIVMWIICFILRRSRIYQ